MNTLFALLCFITSSVAFECYTCNNHKGANDALPCIDKKELCEEGVESCSMVTYFSHFTNKVHMRKFCTSKGTAIYQYLLFFPGSSLCQNIKTANLISPIRRRRSVALPPAPPVRQSSSLLCVCTTPLCNGGTHEQVLDRNLKDNLALLAPPKKTVAEMTDNDLFA